LWRPSSSSCWMLFAGLCACISLRWRIGRRRGVRKCGMGGGKMAVRLLLGRRGRVLLVRPWLGTRGSIVVRPWLLDVSQLIELRLSLSGLPCGIRDACQNVESRSGGELGPAVGTCSDITSKDPVSVLFYRQHFIAITNHPK
jgi:hypothetical protein